MALTDLLSPDAILSALRVNGKKQALQEMSERAAQVSGLPAREIFDALLQRERLGSTGVGDGIAIPHVRNPVVLHVPKAMISLWLLAAPIEFGAVDGKPVHALFSLISPTVRTHLHMLSRLAFALRDTGFKAAVTRRSSPEEILKEARRVETGLAKPVLVAHKEGQR
jgi:PTS system nitrogen regulatory IIA component